MSVNILHGDCRAILPTLPAGTFQCCVTSPPYYGLRDYGVAGQIGLEPTPDEYVAEMVAVFREVRRVLRDDGVLFLNVGDSYHRTQTTNVPQSKNPKVYFPSLPERGRRADACDTSDKAPANSPERDCLCGSLCGACRKAYRLGKSHSDSRHVPTPAASSLSSNPEHTGSQSDRLPTSDCAHPESRTEGAIPDLGQGVPHASVLPLGAPASTTLECETRPRGARSLDDASLGCRLCGAPLPDCVLASADTTACTCGIASRSDASNPNTSGKPSSDSAYPSYTTTFRPKPKDLLGIPWLLAFALRADGWYLRSDIIWHKPNPMPESVRDRPTSAHEHVFLLSKAPSYYYDADAIREPASDALLKQINEGYEGRDTKDFASAGVQSASGTKARIIANARAKIDKQRGHSRRHAGFNDRWNALSRDEQMAVGSNSRNVWTIATQPFSGHHFAVMPRDLAERCIKAGSRAGDAVLDPFGGAGTTGLVADRLGRNATLIELNPQYRELAAERITSDAPLLAGVA